MKPAADGRVTHFLGVDFAGCGLAGALDWVVAASKGGSFTYFVTPNVDHIVMFHGEGEEPWRSAYRTAVAESGLCLNDSRILQRLARASGIPLEPVPGSDLTRALIEGGLPPGTRIALVGGQDREAQWLRAALPDVTVSHLNPPMGVRDNPALHDRIAQFVESEGADIVFLAMGAPQSEIVAHTIARRARARGVGLCIGASIEFLSGARARAPRAMQRMGLEWAFRLLSEPRRLWRRYLVEGPRIFLIWLRHRPAG